jgi:hypothetical protein
MRRVCRSLWPLLSAAIGDALVESVSNSGLFGKGYDDDNHLSVIPALVAGMTLVLLVVAVRTWSLLRSGSSLRRGDWLAESAAEFVHAPSRFDLPAVLAIQFTALFLMESVEQLFFGGKLLGGTVWLGGPIAFSVLTHALLGAACMALFAGIVRWLHAAIASLVREAVEAILFSRSRAGARAFLTRGPDSSPLRAQSPHVRQIGGRAPPLPAVV